MTDPREWLSESPIASGAIFLATAVLAIFGLSTAFGGSWSNGDWISTILLFTIAAVGLAWGRHREDVKLEAEDAGRRVRRLRGFRPKSR